MKGNGVGSILLPVLIGFFEDWGGGVGIGGIFFFSLYLANAALNLPKEGVP